MTSALIAQELRSFRNTGSALFIAAHPDDENTRLLAWLSRERGARTAYLSLTRGDGGQNLLGPELREALGAIRTQELLAARRIDGCEQFFTRANDFGFSKSPEETLAIWDREAVLGDVVRIIRTFQPDILIVPFSPNGGRDTHGHHTASAMLAVEAFKLAGDPQAYPEQLDGGLQPWQPKRLIGGFYRRPGPDNTSATPPAGTVRIDIGGYNPLLGESYGEIAARSRSMHKSQGFGSTGSRGASPFSLETIAGEPMQADLFDGVATTWARLPGGDAIGVMIDKVLASFDPLHPAASVPALLEIRAALAPLPANAIVDTRRAQLDRVIEGCLGLFVETTLPDAEVVAGESLSLRHTVILRANPGVPVRWTAVRFPGRDGSIDVEENLAIDIAVSREAPRLLPADTPISQPYWLRTEGTLGTYAIDDPAMVGRPENPPVLPVEHVFEIGGQTLVVADEPVQVIRDPVRGEIRRRLEVVPPVSLAFAEDVVLLAPGTTRDVAVEVRAARAHMSGTLSIDAPGGWTITPAQQTFALDNAGQIARLVFQVAAPKKPTTASLVASAEAAGGHWHNARVDIRYDHIPPLLLQPLARVKAVCVDLAVSAKRVGYLPGAGDLVAENLARMGCSVTMLADADLSEERLANLDAVVIGIRAFSSRPELAAKLPALYAWVEGGGTLVVQYNTPGRDLTDFAPFKLRIGRGDRVTDENAPIRLLAPDHPALTTPNRITAADFEGWVQERGLYFPSEWDPRFVPLLECADPGETPQSGSLLVAQHGRGWFVYTGLSFFRELPAGVPGAYRLFANLLSLGRSGESAAPR